MQPAAERASSFRSPASTSIFISATKHRRTAQPKPRKRMWPPSANKADRGHMYMLRKVRHACVKDHSRLPLTSLAMRHLGGVSLATKSISEHRRSWTHACRTFRSQGRLEGLEASSYTRLQRVRRRSAISNNSYKITPSSAMAIMPANIFG